MEDNNLFPTNEGTPQGGPLSPLLANITLHGIENQLNQWVKTWKGIKKKNQESFAFIRYCDDFLIIHESKEIIEKAKELTIKFLQPIGLKLKEEKTRIVHTSSGFDFLGFNIRQYPMGKHHSGKRTNGERLGFKTLIKPSQKTIKKHYDQIAKIIRANKSSSQEALIAQLNPVITGWCNYNKTVVSKEIFTNLDHLTYQRLKRWAKRRHPNKGKKWLKKKYWKTVELRNWVFKSNDGAELKEHSSTPIIRHIKVRGNKSPFDGDKIYWGKRLQASTELTTREHKLLKKQKGKCTICHIEFKTGELWEIDHIIPRKHGG